MGLSQLFTRKKVARTPDDHLIVAVGDIHGELHQLKSLLEQLPTSTNIQFKEIVFLGDYIDRGPSSKGILELLSEEHFLPEWKKVFLKGNHEALLLSALEDGDYYTWLNRAGGRETIASYGIEPTLEDASDQENEMMLTSFFECFPLEHLAFIKNLKTHYHVGDYMFAHAGINPKHGLDDQEEADLLWIRKPFLTSKKSYGKTIIHGHTPTKQPEVKPNRIGIDTGCGRGGYLSAVVLTEDKAEFISAP